MDSLLLRKACEAPRALPQGRCHGPTCFHQQLKHLSVASLDGSLQKALLPVPSVLPSVQLLCVDQEELNGRCMPHLRCDLQGGRVVVVRRGQVRAPLKKELQGGRRPSGCDPSMKRPMGGSQEAHAQCGPRLAQLGRGQDGDGKRIQVGWRGETARQWEGGKGTSRRARERKNERFRRDGMMGE